MTTQTRAIVYLRQSLDKTNEGLAVARQRQACEQLCAARGWTVADVLTENDTSALRKRPVFDDLLQRVERGEVDVIVVWHVDRLVRRLEQLEQVITLCEEHKVKLATVSGDIDLSTDAGRLVGRILASVARGEVERKSARQKAANRQRAEEGMPHAGGWRALGYAQDGVTILPDEAAAIRTGFELILAGGSLRAVGRDWSARGLTATKSARKARPTWTWASVRQVLLNPRYAGIRAYCGEEFPAQWPAIVSEEVFRAVSAMLTSPDRRTPPAMGIGLLTGIATCGTCGSPCNITGGSPRRVQDGGPRRTRIYRCTGEPGRHVTRKAEPIDDLVSRLVVARLSAPDAIGLLARTGPDLSALATEREAILKRQRQLADEFGSGALPMVTLKTAAANLEKRLKKVDQDLAAASRQSALSPLVSTDDVQAVWDTLDVDRQRAVIRELFSEVALLPVGRGTRVFRPESVRIEWRRDEE